MPSQKHILTINDISCIGKCSLTVALPIVSAMGHTVSILPTVLLSSHTGGFRCFTRDELTENVRRIVDAWRPLELSFDCICSGYLACAQQLEIVSEVIERYRQPKTLVVVDPVMADNGKMYCGFDPSYVDRMRQLCRRADLLLPNLTEAMLLADMPWQPQPSLAQVQRTLDQLLQLAPAAAITGVPTDQHTISVFAGTREGARHRIDAPLVQGVFHGTGDLLTSVCVGALMRGQSFDSALGQAVQFVSAAIANTPAEYDFKYGLWFEPLLLGLVLPD